VDLKPFLESVSNWIWGVLREGGNVLVHCQQVCLCCASFVVVFSFFLSSNRPFYIGYLPFSSDNNRLPHAIPRHVVCLCLVVRRSSASVC